MDHDSFMGVAAQHTAGDATKMKIGEEVAAACAGITGSDRCDMGAKLVGCIKDEATKRKQEYGV